MKILLLILGLAWSTLSAAAAPCAPGEDSSSYLGVTVASNLSDRNSDLFVVWHCYSKAPFENRTTPPGPSRHCLVQSWGSVTLRMLGDRADRIINSTDRSAAFAAALRRHVQNPSDPRCVALLKKHR